MGTKKSGADSKEGGAVDTTEGGAVIKEISHDILRDFIEEKLPPQEMNSLCKRYQSCGEFRQLVDQFHNDHCKEVEIEGKASFAELSKNLPKLEVKPPEIEEMPLLEDKVSQIWQKIKKEYL